MTPLALIPLFLLLLNFSPAGLALAARNPLVQISGGDSLSIWVAVDWDEPLPPFVQDRLERGIPATVGLRVELWKARPGWFDQHLSSGGAEMKVLRDPWGGSFSILGENGNVTVDSIGALQSSLSRQQVRLPLEEEWCDESSAYSVVVTTFVRPLTAKDVGEVEDWLRGELRGFGGLLGLPRGLFGIVRDLSGLGEQTRTGSSPKFRLSRLPDDRVRVLIPGGPVGATVRVP